MCEWLEPCAVWVERLRTARRAHDCPICQGVIQPRTRYVEIRSLYDGAWATVRAHAECCDLARYVCLEVCGGDLWSPYVDVEHELEQHDDADLRQRWTEIQARRDAEACA